MSKSTEKCLPFYKILKKDKRFRWSKDCKDTFAKLKEYISTSSILTRLEEGETLFLYVVAFNKAIAIMLIMEWDGE